MHGAGATKLVAIVGEISIHLQHITTAVGSLASVACGNVLNVDDNAVGKTMCWQS